MVKIDLVGDESLWYFAYGSNMSPAIFVDRRGMQPIAARRAWLDGYRLRFNLPIGPAERGVANVEPDPGARVWGVAYLLRASDFDRLDETEGVHRGVYRRIAVELSADPLARISGFTYRSSFSTAGRRPSARYLGLLLEGARHHALPEAYVRELEAFELAVDERQPLANPRVT